MPNRFGLFDMLGNVREWCHSPFYPNPLRYRDQWVCAFREAPEVHDNLKEIFAALFAAERFADVRWQGGEEQVEVVGHDLLGGDR